MSLIRDPCFWKRFSTAVHLDEESKAVNSETLPKQARMSWLSRERQKRRRSIIWGFVIFFGVVFIVIAAIVIWWLAKNNWLQRGPDATA